MSRKTEEAKSCFLQICESAYQLCLRQERYFPENLQAGNNCCCGDHGVTKSLTPKVDLKYCGIRRVQGQIHAFITKAVAGYELLDSRFHLLPSGEEGFCTQWVGDRMFPTSKVDMGIWAYWLQDKSVTLSKICSLHLMILQNSFMKMYTLAKKLKSILSV